ncbi:hypothetical protein JL722_5668 [Aureococcus anophagefferens]|nr:hypothetical protein JL722_5668 [Aureococcus anophagefferens]
MVKSSKKKSSKKRSKAKSKKQAMRSATFAAKKLIDSAIAAGVRAQAEDAADEGDESMEQMALADTEGAPPDADDADGDEDDGDGDDDAEGEDAMDADDPLTSMAAQGSAFAAAAIERALKTAPDAWAEFWADAPDVVAIDAEGTHFTPPLLLQICARGPRRRVLLVAPTGDALGDDVARLLGDASITKVFFGPPSREHLGAAIANAVDAQAFEVAATGSSASSGSRGRRGRRAPARALREAQGPSAVLRLLPVAAPVRPLPQPPLARRAARAAAGAWATLALYESLAAEGHAPAREDAPATAPRASRSPPKPPKPTKAAGLRELARSRGASRSPPKPAAPAPAADFMAT